MLIQGHLCVCIFAVIAAFIRHGKRGIIVFRADSEGAKEVDQLQRRIREGVSRLKGLDMGDELSVEILGQLIHTRRTLTEITEAIYGLSRSEEGYQSSYSKVTREIRRLESKGLVSRKLFGKDKPYRLTQHAVINLARIGGEEAQLPIVPRIDLTAYMATIAISLVAALHAKDLVSLPEAGALGLFVLFGLAAGISLTRGLQTIRRVL